MARLHAANRYERLMHDVEAITGRRATSVRDFVAQHTQRFGPKEPPAKISERLPDPKRLTSRTSLRRGTPGVGHLEPVPDDLIHQELFHGGRADPLQFRTQLFGLTLDRLHALVQPQAAFCVSGSCGSQW